MKEIVLALATFGLFAAVFILFAITYTVFQLYQFRKWLKRIAR